MEPFTLFDDCVKLYPSFTVRKATPRRPVFVFVMWGNIKVKCEGNVLMMFYVIEWDKVIKCRIVF